MSTVTPNYGLIKPGVNDPADQDLWGEMLNENMDTIDTVMKSNSEIFPVGSVIDWAGTSAPSKFLLCYGQAVSRSTYSALFSVTGTTYGSGDGSTTFNLPDLRGRVVAGKDDMGGVSANRLTLARPQGVNGDTLGGSGGEEAHTPIEAEMFQHDHPSGVGISTGNVGIYSNTATDVPGNATARLNTTATAPDQQPVTKEVGSSTPFNVVQPTFILNKIIYAGV